MKKLLLLSILIGFAFCAESFCDDTVYEGAGTSSAQYLKIGIGARAAALGDSYTSLSDDAFGIFWNPAGMSRIQSIEGGLLYNSWISDISQEVFAVSVPFSSFARDKKSVNPEQNNEHETNMRETELPANIGTISFGAMFLNMPQIQGSDIYGNETDKYLAYSMVLVLSYSSRLFSDNLSFGINGKYLKETIEKESASGNCLDYGIMYRSGAERFSLGAAMQNVGNDFKFVSESFSLPRNLKFGVSYWFLDEKFLMAADSSKANDENTRYSLGAELCPTKNLSLRCGWQSINSATFGFGVKYQSAFFDYAYAPYENLGGTHKASLRIRYDSPIKINLKSRKKNSYGMMPYDTACIFGSVKDKDGKPLHNIIIKVSKEDREKARFLSNKDGIFITEELPFGTYEIKAWSELCEAGYMDVKLDAKEGAHVDFVLTPPKNENHIYGMIVDDKGQALKDIVVKVSLRGEEKLRVITDRDGTYTTGDLPYGVYELKIWKQEEDKSVTKKCKVKRGKPVQMDFVF